MEVLDAPQGYEDWSVNVECKKEVIESYRDKSPCGVRLKVGLNDLIVMYWKGAHASRNYYAAIECPWCGKINSVPNVPPPIWKVVQDRKPRFDGYIEE
jgi:hypothetical protein